MKPINAGTCGEADSEERQFKTLVVGVLQFVNYDIWESHSGVLPLTAL